MGTWEERLIEFATQNMDEIMLAAEEDDCLGFCIVCGAEADGVEPDAKEYECEVCGANGVYGAEELLLYVA